MAIMKLARRRKTEVPSDFCFKTAGADHTPSGHGFKNGEQARGHKGQSQPPQNVAGNDDTHNQAQPPDHPAGHAAAMIQIGL